MNKAVYERALQTMQACNLSGLAHDLSEAVSQIWEEAQERGEGTDYVNTHPVVRLYVDQMCLLAFPKDSQLRRIDEVMDAIVKCQAEAKVSNPPQAARP